jgi:hypothetical protein
MVFFCPLEKNLLNHVLRHGIASAHAHSESVKALIMSFHDLHEAGHRFSHAAIYCEWSEALNF